MSLILLEGRDLAATLGVRYETVLSWARVGKIPRVKTGSGRVVFNLDRVVESLMAEQDAANSPQGVTSRAS